MVGNCYAPRHGKSDGKRLGFTGALGTKAEIIDGVYTGKIIGNLLHGREKASAIKKLAIEKTLNLKIAMHTQTHITIFRFLNQLEIQEPLTQMHFLKFEPTEIIGRFTIFVGLEELKNIRTSRWATCCLRLINLSSEAKTQRVNRPSKTRVK